MTAELNIKFELPKNLKKQLEKSFNINAKINGSKDKQSSKSNNITELNKSLKQTTSLKNKLNKHTDKSIQRFNEFNKNFNKSLSKIDRFNKKFNSVISNLGKFNRRLLKFIGLKPKPSNSQTKTISKNKSPQSYEEGSIAFMKKHNTFLTKMRNITGDIGKIAKYNQAIEENNLKIKDKSKLGLDNENTIAKKSSKGGVGGKGMAAIMGGVAGLMIQLVQSSKAIQTVLNVIGGMIDALVGPLLPIIISLMKPLFSILLFAMGFIIKFFQNPGEALKDLFNGLIEGIGNLLGFGGKDKQGDASSGLGAIMGAIIGAIVGGPWGALLGALIGPMIMDAGIAIVGGILDFGAFLGEKLAEGTMLVGSKIAEFSMYLGEKLAEGVMWVYDGIVTGLNILWDIGTWIWDKLKESLSSAWDLISGFGTWIWDKLKESLSSAWDLIAGFGTWVYDKMKDVGLLFANGIVKALNTVISAINSIDILGYSPSISKIPSINDGVVDPSGRVVSVNPSDYIMAAKNPRDLQGGNSSNGNNITINLTVNGSTDNNMINTIVKKLRTELSKRGAF